VAELAFLLALVAVFVALNARSSATLLRRDLARTSARLRALEDARQVDPQPHAPAAVAATPAAPVEPAPAPRAEPARALFAAPPPPAPPAPSFEERIGTRWAVWVGGLALALGGVLLVRYSIEQGVFGPAVRLVLGALFSAALVGAGEWFRRSELASPVEVIPTAHIPGILTAAGTISAFGTVYAAHALYAFVGPGLAFALLGAIGIATLLAALLHGPALAGLGLAGAFAVPLLVASHGASKWSLVIYLAVVACAAHGLAWLRRWLLLAFAAVAGAVVWGFALAAFVSGGNAIWATALFAHALLQLALSSAFLVREPHRSVADELARPDWVASAALAALALLVLLALAAAPLDARWIAFAFVAMGMLSGNAWQTAPAASGAALAGVVALGGMLCWPRTALYASAAGFLAFGAVSTLAIGASAGLRLWRGRALPSPTAGLYALAATVAPLLGLVLAYLRVWELERSLAFALSAVLLAGLFAVAMRRFEEIPAAEGTPATRLTVGALASAVAAALALACVMALERGYLTVAFAATALATAHFAVERRIPLLRTVVVALGLIVLGRLAWDPRIMGQDLGTWPIFNWLLLGYGAPACAFLAAGRILAREREDTAARLCDALGLLLAALLGFFEIRHALHGGDPLAPSSGHVELGLVAVLSLGFASVLIRMDVARANPVFRIASTVFGVIAIGVIGWGLGLLENPLLESDRVLGPVVLSSLTLGYLLPAIAAVVLARTARGVRPREYVTSAAVLALLLVFGYVTLEVRHAFQGAYVTLEQGASAAEISAYSVAWLALGLAFLGYGIWRSSSEARLASLALVLLSVLKVFLYDLTGIGGFWRAFSMICLGAVLIGIGLVYQRLVFARPHTTPPRDRAQDRA